MSDSSKPAVENPDCPLLRPSSARHTGQCIEHPTPTKHVCPLRIFAAFSLAIVLVRCAPVDEVQTTVSEVTVGSLRGNPACSTAGAEGLSAQLVDEVVCLSAGRLVPFAPAAGITLTNPRIHPLSSPAARDGIQRAAARTPLRINSALRTLVEQYLLYTSAGCGLVATPGNSNHETGRAVDVDNYAAANAAMTANGFTHTYPGNDPVHYDGPGDDFRATSVRAFQRLWNANNPGDRIAEDGQYGPMTEARLARSPAEGFRIGRVCNAPPPMMMMMPPPDPVLRAQFVSQTFPPSSMVVELMPGQERMGYFELRNTGTATWSPGTTFLVTTQPRDRMSAVATAMWSSPSRPATVDRAVAPGSMGRFAFAVTAPAAGGEVNEYFGLYQQGVGWFSDPMQGGPPDNLLQIRVRGGRAAFAAEVAGNSFVDNAMVEPMTTLTGTITLRNTGSSPWVPGRTFLATTEPHDHESDFFHDSWTSTSRVMTVPNMINVGETWSAAFSVVTPATGGPHTETFNLVDETGGWFSDMGNGGPADTAIRIRVIHPGAPPDPDAGGVEQDGAVFTGADSSRPRDGRGGTTGVTPDTPGTAGGCGCRTLSVPASEGLLRQQIVSLFAIAAALVTRRRARQKP